jgi:hypothetical protein
LIAAGNATNSDEVHCVHLPDDGTGVYGYLSGGHLSSCGDPFRNQDKRVSKEIEERVGCALLRGPLKQESPS